MPKPRYLSPLSHNPKIEQSQMETLDTNSVSRLKDVESNKLWMPNLKIRYEFNDYPSNNEPIPRNPSMTNTYQKFVNKKRFSLGRKAVYAQSNDTALVKTQRSNDSTEDDKIKLP